MTELAQTIQKIQQRNLQDQEALYNPAPPAPSRGGRRQKMTQEQLQRQCQVGQGRKSLLRCYEYIRALGTVWLV